jgi:hypothetical protein
VKHVLAVWVLGWLALSPLVADADEEQSRVRTVAAPDGGEPVTAKTDAHGAIHLLYDRVDGPRYAKFASDGKPVGEPIALVDRASQKPKWEFHGWDLAVGQGGRVHVALGTNAWKLKLPHEEWGWFYARLEPGATAFSPLRNINRKPSEGFSLAADDKGNVTACWLARKLYANVSRDNGATFEPTVEIDAAFDPCDCCTTSATYAADGKLAVFYREETNNERDMFLALWDQAQNQVSRTRVSSTLWKTDVCPVTYYSISRHGDGFIATWPTRGQVYFARLDRKGELQSPLEIKTPGQSGMRTGVVAVSAPDGSILAAWNKEGRIGWQVYDAKGNAVGSPGAVKTAGKGVAAVANKDSRFLLFH